MKVSGASRIFVAVACSLFLAGSMKISRLAAQDEPATRQESVESLQITANDEIAAEDVAGHHVHLHPLRTSAASRGRYEDTEVRRGNPRQEFSNGESPSSNSALSTVPGVPAPGFYPADISNPGHGRVLTTTQSNNVYVNCAASCWGTPSNFLARLATSNFIHVTDQYVGSTGSNRYTAWFGVRARLPHLFAQRGGRLHLRECVLFTGQQRDLCFLRLSRGSGLQRYRPRSLYG